MVNSQIGSRWIAFLKPVCFGLSTIGFAMVMTTCTYSDVGPSISLNGFESRLEYLRTLNKIPGMIVGVSREEQAAWIKPFGYADVENKIPVQSTTLFHLASLTKTYASTVIMQLVEKHVVDLEDPVSKYGIQLSGSGIIRVKHLLTHTSEGIPGNQYNYNGDRFALLDEVIKSSGSSFHQLLSEKILIPLALTQTAPCVMSLATSIGLDKEALTKNLAQGYSLDGTERIAYPNYFGPAAGLIATVGDVLIYSSALEGTTLLSNDTKAQIFSPAISNSGDPLPYGLGWFVQTIEGKKIVWHYGLWTGISSLIIKVPDEKLTFVILANSSMLSYPYPLGRGDLLQSPFAKEFLKSFVLAGAVL